MISYIILFLATIVQNLSFTVVSRARNSNSKLFHGLAAVASNGMWFIVANSVIAKPDSVPLGITYTAGAVVGSLLGHELSMNYLEKLFVKKPKDGQKGNSGSDSTLQGKT
jgi:uncharacterized membrane protein YfcA